MRSALARIKSKVARVAHEAPLPASRCPIRCDLRLNPPLRESEVVAFEEKHRITLPEEYRTFLLEVGNGGMGPGEGLKTLTESAERSPTSDLDRPFPFSFRMYQEDEGRFIDARRNEPYHQPGVLFLAAVEDPWVSVYLVITGEDRGLVWGCGLVEGGWNPEAPTWEGDQRAIDGPPRRFLRWYEDWLNVILPNADGDGEDKACPARPE
ncbi:SMI1/KNR4 family protein [Gemmata sp. JC673]|uniref:SMI1/KNR4 family protein n=1 Tax=Gemmata algarum TaxID=2975278 RepID=A0ABU5EU79_9BACT|nr:SMI1/KNR4 family protein [Gemmata algarum]MDY3558533.1 SMI1/KNR4 family protein [Gemmata algarum]